jgi:hypothetical protein
MRRTIPVLLLAALIPAAASAHPRHPGCAGIQVDRVEWPVTWGAHHDLAHARFAILTEDHAAVLVLTRDRVAVQLSDQVLHEVDREIAREQDRDEDDALGGAIKGAVLGGVRALVNQSLDCPIEELRDVRCRDGRLILITEDGDRIFEDLNVNGHDVLVGFSERDAQTFVREFRRAKEHGG